MSFIGILALAASPAFAQDPPADDAPAAEAKADPPPGPPPTEFALSGLYTAWGLTQQNFMLGADHPLDDALYTVQMLRTKLDIKKGRIGATTRLDLGQGWWGANNSSNTQDVTTFDADGNPVETNAYNENALFENKDTNYTVHVDLAYGWAEFDLGNTPLRVQAGRQYYGVGHKLVLDQDMDGIVATLAPGSVKLDLMWAKVSEGRGAFKDPKGLVMSDKEEFRDADLVGTKLRLGKRAKGDDPGTKHHGEVFALYYMDQTAQTDWAWLPNGLGYFRSRFAPQVSSAMAFGLAGDGVFKKDLKDTDEPGFLWKGEVDFLIGTDDVDNKDHAGGAVDINDGNLIGYNAYLDLKQEVAVAKGMDVGAVFGFGSGDSDRTGGAGNINKIQTMGFFPFTNVWEDSVMPDIQGISPQGLGSPVSRGYREFENTIAVMPRIGVKPVKPLKLDLAYAFLRATTPIQGFDAAGTPTKKSSSDIGQEIDLNATVKFDNGLILKTLSGVFLPGSGGAFLINGSDASLDAAWEIKTVAVVKF